MENEFWNFSDQLRVETSANFANLSIGDSIWANPFPTRGRNEERRNVDNAAAERLPSIIGAGQTLAKQNFQPQPQAEKPGFIDFNSNNGGWKTSFGGSKSAFANNTNSFLSREIARPGNLLNKEVNKSVNGLGQHPRRNNDNNDLGKGKGVVGGKKNSANKNNNINDRTNNDKVAVDKRFKTLPASEALPRNEAIGGYIFVCNNDTMQENLRRQLFGEFSPSF